MKNGWYKISAFDGLWNNFILFNNNKPVVKFTSRFEQYLGIRIKQKNITPL